MKKIIIIIAIPLSIYLGFALFANYFGEYIYSEPKQGTLIDTFTVTKGQVDVRAQVFGEGSKWGSKNGCHIIMEGKSTSANYWGRITNARYDECPTLSFSEHIKSINNKTVYVFWEVAYVVTTDGGNTWNHWNVARNMPSKVYDGNGNLIQSVGVDSQGRGEMILNPQRTQGNQMIKLTTNDYGVSWKE